MKPAGIMSKKRLVDAASHVYAKYRDKVEASKREHKHWASPDFIWEALLLSAATWGNAQGGRLVHEAAFHDPIRYKALQALASDTQRREVLADCLTKAKVRYAARKVEYLVENFRRIEASGGPEAVKKELISQPGAGAKIKFLDTFKGIGPKYARNMMMDVYHEDFRDSIAIDVRLQKVLSTLGIEFNDAGYRPAESFLVEVAHEAGLNGWELDRLLFSHIDEVLELIDTPAERRPKRTAAQRARGWTREDLYTRGRSR